MGVHAAFSPTLERRRAVKDRFRERPSARSSFWNCEYLPVIAVRFWPNRSPSSAFGTQLVRTRACFLISVGRRTLALWYADGQASDTGKWPRSAELNNGHLLREF